MNTLGLSTAKQIPSFRDLPSLSGANNPDFDSIFLLKNKTCSSVG